jgi:hypothetical protein
MNLNTEVLNPGYILEASEALKYTNAYSCLREVHIHGTCEHEFHLSYNDPNLNST